MPKNLFWLLFGLSAVCNFIMAALGFLEDRPVKVWVNAFAGLLFIVAAALHAKASMR